MTDNSDLIERLRKAAQHAGLLLVDPPKPSPEMALLDQAASALSSQSLSLSEARAENDRKDAEIERLKGLVDGIRQCPQEPSRKERAGALEELRRLRDDASFGELWGGNGSRYLLGDRSDEDSSKHLVVARQPVCRDGDAQRWQHDATFIAACVTYVLDRIEPVHIRDIEGRIRRFFQENVGATRVECATALRIDRRTVWKHLKRMREASNV